MVLAAPLGHSTLSLCHDEGDAEGEHDEAEDDDEGGRKNDKKIKKTPLSMHCAESYWI